MIKIGQTWRTKGGAIVHVASSCHISSDRFMIERDNGAQSYTVDAAGVSRFLEDSDLGELMMRVYIAGPMTGYEDLNFPEFHRVAKLYRDRGCYVINPAEINGGYAEVDSCAMMSKAEYHEHWLCCMKADIAALLTCEMIVMLPGWRESKGASLEHDIAYRLDFSITYECK